MIIRKISCVCLFAGLAAVALFSRMDSAEGQDTAQPIALTEQHIQGFVAALPEITSLVSARQATRAPWSEAEMEAFAKKYGFSTYEQFAEVSASISIVMAGVDPRTRVFTEPKAVLEGQIRELVELRNQLAQEFKTLPELKSPIPSIDAKIAGMRETAKDMPVRINPQNVLLVNKYFDQIILASSSARSK